MITEICKRPIMRWHGGKWRLAPWVISHFPDHEMYVEPFAGAASVLLRKPRSRTEVLNDLNSRVVNLFRVLRSSDSAIELRRLLYLTPYSIEEFQKAREVSDDSIEDARRMIVLGQMGHGSTGASGGKKTGWRRYGGRPTGPDSSDEWTALIDHHLETFVQRLRHVYLECEDYSITIERCDSPRTLFYCDPPYLDETRKGGLRGYAHELSDEDHVALAERLRGVKGMVVLSGYFSSLYDELYAGWQRVETAATGDKQAKVTEVLWLNPRAAENLNGGGFFV